RAVAGWVNAKRTLRQSDSGSGWPCRALSRGLGSNRSIWLGAPSREMQMHALAPGATCGGRRANRLPASYAPSCPSRPSSFSSDARARAARPLAVEVRKWWREGWMESIMFNLLRPQLVQELGKRARSEFAVSGFV